MPLSRRFFLRGNKAIRASMVWVVFSFSTLAFSSQAFAAGLYNVGAFWIPTFYHLPNDTQGAQWTTSTISLPVTATGQNNLMVVGMSWCCNGSGHIPTVSDNKGNTWTVAKRNTTKTACDTTGDCLAIDYAVSATAGVTTVSIAPNTEQYVSVIYGEFNGNVTSGFFDNAQFASPTNNVVTSTPLTPTNP